MERLETLAVTELGVPVRDGRDPSDELIAFLTAEGVTGAVNALSNDSAAEVYGVVFADEAGAPAQWFPDGAAVGFGRGELEGFRMRLRERFGQTAWVGQPDAPTDDGDRRAPFRGWGIRSFAWYTESHQFGVPELVAGALGGAVIWAPVGKGLLFVARDPQALVLSEYWRKGRSVLMWATGTRRAFAVSGWLNAELHWWDEHTLVADPSDGWQVDHEGLTVRQIVERLSQLDPAFPAMTKLARVPEDRRQDFRIELRRPSSSPDTLARVAEICGLPPQVALVAEGMLDPLGLPGAAIAEPATMAGAIWSESRMPLPGPLRWLQWWPRVTARRPLWYRILTAAVVMGALVVATLVVVVQGRSPEHALLPLVAAAVSTRDFARPRARDPLAAASPTSPTPPSD